MSSKLSLVFISTFSTSLYLSAFMDTDFPAHSSYLGKAGLQLYCIVLQLCCRQSGTAASPARNQIPARRLMKTDGGKNSRA